MREPARLEASEKRPAARPFGLPTIAVLITGAIFLSAAPAAPSGAADQNAYPPLSSERAAARRGVWPMNKSVTVNVETPFARAIVGAPEFADVLPLSALSLYIQA